MSLADERKVELAFRELLYEVSPKHLVDLFYIIRVYGNSMSRFQAEEMVSRVYKEYEDDQL
ncbi:MAG: hypothetical protein COA84_13640 [Robiginitomaculum sp.]|nr:MAG: hypothetical protein COA84_13640 [Robiginitomaculum sp.]